MLFDTHSVKVRINILEPLMMQEHLWERKLLHVVFVEGEDDALILFINNTYIEYFSYQIILTTNKGAKSGSDKFAEPTRSKNKQNKHRRQRKVKDIM